MLFTFFKKIFIHLAADTIIYTCIYNCKEKSYGLASTTGMLVMPTSIHLINLYY